MDRCGRDSSFSTALRSAIVVDCCGIITAVVVVDVVVVVVVVDGDDFPDADVDDDLVKCMNAYRKRKILISSQTDGSNAFLATSADLSDSSA